MNVAQPLVQASLIGEAIDPGPALVLVADEQMRYVAANQFACDALGYTREELLGLRIPDVSRSPEAAAAKYEAFVSSGEQRGTIVLVRKDGSELPIDYRAQETRVAGMTLYVSIAFPLGD